MASPFRVAALAAAVTLALVAAFSAGLFFDEVATWLDRSEPPDQTEDRAGRWRAADAPLEPTDPAAASSEALGSLPYLAGYHPAVDSSGVVVHVPGRTADGANLVVSGHDTATSLVDLDGRTIHTWTLPPPDTWTQHAPPDEDFPPLFAELDFWRYAHPLAGGDLLAIYEGAGLVRLDGRSRVRWARWRGAHHHLDPVAPGAEDGPARAWVLERSRRSIDHPPQLRPGIPVFDDRLSLVALDDGRTLAEVSIVDALAASPWSTLLHRLGRGQLDPFHTNSVQWLDGRHADRLPTFSRGRLLVSIRNLDTVAVIDPDAGRVVWALVGRFEQQHDAQLLDNGHLLVFDNRPSDGRSRVVELDPVTQEVAWELADGFFTELLGGVQRLPNGNTLIVESERGRAFETTPDHEIVWEWLSPHRAGDDGELVATLCELWRIDPTILR